MIQFPWVLRTGEVFTPPPSLGCGVMGIVNVTPDSFYDGGAHNMECDAFRHAHRLREEGAHILDIGAESSRPGAVALTASEEMPRLMALVRKLCAARDAALQTPAHVAFPPSSPSLPDVGGSSTHKCEAGQAFPFLSVDTYHARTALACLEAGVDIVNDISACRFEPELLDIIAQFKPGYVLMHSPDRAKGAEDRFAIHKNATKGVLDVLCRFFEYHLQRLTSAGVPENRIILDPGIGFGKTPEQNFCLLRNVKRLRKFGRPVLMGLSMKSLFSLLCTSLPQRRCADILAARTSATQCATALLVAQNVCLIHRVHHVVESLRTIQLTHLMRTENLAQNFVHTPSS